MGCNISERGYEMKYCSKCGNEVFDDAVVCVSCGRSLDRNPNYRAVARLETNRSLLKFLLLSLITFNIYGVIVMSTISTDINIIASRYDGKKTRHFCLMSFVLSWLTLGIYPFFWYHQLSNRIGNELDRRDLGYQFSSNDFWMWGILGSFIIVGPFIYLNKLLTAMNMLADDYNYFG